MWKLLGGTSMGAGVSVSAALTVNVIIIMPICGRITHMQKVLQRAVW